MIFTPTPGRAEAVPTLLLLRARCGIFEADFAANCDDPGRGDQFAGGGVDGDTLSRHVDDNSYSSALVVDRARRIQAAYRDERGLGGKGSPLIRMTNKPGKAGLSQPAMLRSSTMAQAGSTPARQHQYPARAERGGDGLASIA